jgi:hypothetical protein
MAVTASDFETIGAFVGKAIKPLQDRIAELESTKMSWKGTWRPGNDYRVHDVTQDKGNLFICQAPSTAARPGTGAGWRMMTKSAEKAK